MASPTVGIDLVGTSSDILKHLEMIQRVISRMAQNSFLVKGWSIAMVTAILAASSHGASVFMITLSLLPAITFWYLDAYYLRQERLFRDLYNHVATKKESPSGGRFSMETSSFERSFWNSMFSPTIWPLHAILIVGITGCMAYNLATTMLSS